MRSNSAPAVRGATFGLVLAVSCLVLGVLMVVDERSVRAWSALALFVAALAVHVLRLRRALRGRRSPGRP